MKIENPDQEKKTKIVLCHNTFAYLYQHYSELIRELDSTFDEVVCVAPSDETINDLESIGVRCHPIDLSRSGIGIFKELRALFCYATLFRQERPDVIMNFSIKPVIYSGLVARFYFRHRAVFSMITGLGYVFIGNSYRQRLLRALTRVLYKWSLTNSAVVFFQNTDDRDEFIRQGLINEERTRVLPGTGINLQRFLPKERRNFRGIFLFIGRLLKDKGIDELVTACRLLSKSYENVQLQLLGPIDENPSSFTENEVRAWEAEGFCKYLGVQGDVRPYIEHADVFVLPSYREGLPRATLEAMAMGKPVITTAVPGCKETVEEGVNGFLVPAQDTSALAGAIERFLADPSMINRMGDQSRKIAERRFDVKTVIEKVMAEIENVTKQGLEVASSA